MDAAQSFLYEVRRLEAENIVLKGEIAALQRALGLNVADLVTVKELLGHSTVITPMCYAHWNDESKRQAVGRLSTSDKVVTVVPRAWKKAANGQRP